MPPLRRPMKRPWSSQPGGDPNEAGLRWPAALNFFRGGASWLTLDGNFPLNHNNQPCLFALPILECASNSVDPANSCSFVSREQKQGPKQGQTHKNCPSYARVVASDSTGSRGGGRICLLINGVNYGFLGFADLPQAQPPDVWVGFSLSLLTTRTAKDSAPHPPGFPHKPS